MRLVLHVYLIITSALLLRNFVRYEKNMIRNYFLFLRYFAKCRIWEKEFVVYFQIYRYAGTTKCMPGENQPIEARH